MRVFNSWGRPGRSLPPCGLLSLLLLLGLATGAQAQVACTTANSDGSYTVPQNWALKPTGLIGGTTFRLLFVTSTTRNASSSDIADYNTFVQTRAKAGHSAITDSCGNLFKVVGSTASVDARDNTNTNTTKSTPDTDALIYWVNGAKVADNYADFYDNSWDSRDEKEESGGNISSLFPWTGTNTDGTAHSNPLGSSTPRYGSLLSSTSSPLSEGNGGNRSGSTNFYALSPLFKVEAPVVTMSIVPGFNFISEGASGPQGALRITATPGFSSATTVSYSTFRSLATRNEDFTTSGTVSMTGTSGTIFITMIDDNIDENSEAIVLILTAGSGYDLGPSNSILAGVSITDNDTAGITITESGSSTSVQENGGTDTYTVVLDTEPSHSVTITPTSGTATAATVSGALTFSTTNWDTAQTVTVTGVNDSTTGNRSSTITHPASSTDNKYSATFVDSSVTVTVVDDDTPTMSVTASHAERTEGQQVQFTIAASPAPLANISVGYSVSDAPGAQFLQNVSGTRSFSAAQTSRTLSLVSVNDNVDEPDGPISLRINNGSGYLVGTASSATVRMLDNDPTVVSLSRTGTGGIAEGDKVEFTVTLGRALIAGEIIDVPLSVTGTGVTASDWSIGKKSGSGLNTGVTLRTGNVVRFSGAGSRTATLELEALIDNPVDGETYTVALGSNTQFDAGTLGTNVGGGADPHGTTNSFSVAVADTLPGGVLELPVDASSAAEGDAGKFVLAREFTLKRRPVPKETLTFQICVRGTATPGKDYRIRGPKGEGVRGNGCTGTYNIGPQISATTFKYRLEVKGDRDVEPDETVEVYLKDPRKNPRLTYDNGKLEGRFTHTITNDGDDGSPTPTPTVTITGGSAVTEGSPATFTVTRTGATTAALTVKLSVRENNNNGRDFVTSANQGNKQVVIPIGDSSVTYTVATVGDSTHEPTGQVIVEVRNDSAYTKGSPFNATVTVNDDDAPSSPTTPTVSFDSASMSVAEDKSPNTFKVQVNLSPAPTATFNLAYTTTGGTASLGLNPLTDDAFISTPSPIEVAPGSSNVTIDFGLWDDNSNENNETIVLTLSSGSGYTVGSPSVHTVTITDDDSGSPTLPTVTITGGSAVTEGSPATFTVSRTGATTSALTVLLAVSENETARDFVASSNQGNKQVVIQAGSSTATYTVPTVSDTTDEPNGAVTVALRDNSAYTNGSPASATVVVNDDDNQNPALPTVSITPGSAVTEGTAASFTVTRTGATTAALTVLLAVTENPEGGRDFVASGDEGNKEVVIPIGSTTATYTVATVDDSTDEPNGAVTLDLRSSSNYNPGTPPSGTVTVNDNDGGGDGGGGGVGGGGGGSTPPPTVSFASGSRSVAEDVGTQNVQVNLSRPAPTTGITLSYGVGGTATAGSGNDFTIAGSGSVSVPSGATSVTIPVAITDDSLPESSETVVLTLSAGSGYRLGSQSVHTLTVTDNDGPTASFASGSRSVAEDVGTQNVQVNLKPAPTTGITLSYGVGGTATAGSGNDFTIAGSGSVSVPSGATSVTIPVSITDDSLPESSETVVLTLSAGSGYRLGSPLVHTLTITDNDGGGGGGGTRGFAFSPSGLTMAEGESGVYRVMLSTEPTDTVTVAITSDNGDVTVDTDSASSGNQTTLSFTPSNWSQAQTVTVFAGQDGDTNDESATLRHAASGGGYDSVSGTVNVNVRDDDDPGLELSQSSLRVPEGGSASYTMALATQPTADVVVVVSGGESPGVTVTPTRLVFTPGNWNQEQRVTVTAAENAAIGRTVTLSHRASGGGYDGIPLSDVTVRVVSAHPAAAVGGWQLRFGRTVSQQVVDALRQRWSTDPTAVRLIVAGETVSGAVTPPPPLAENEGVLSKVLGFDPLTLQQVVEDSSFNFTPEAEEETETETEEGAEGGAPRFALWGQGALSSFTGEGDALSSLDGDVTTLLLGADWNTVRWQAGAALSRSWGNGSYDGDDNADGEISSTVTGIFPYGRYVLTPRLDIWAVAGYGWGALSLNPDGMEEEYEPDTTMAMVALGMDGLLLDGGSEGISLTTTADLLSMKTTSDEVEGLASSEGNLSRRRLGLEATRPFPLANGASLLPSMEVGIRQDGGDAETGFGLDLGAGITWKDPERGISGELRGRTILTHTEEEFQDQGLAVSFSWDPDPSNRGPSLSVGHTMGATATADMDALFNPASFEQVNGNISSGQQFEAALAYGFPAYNDQLTFTPAVAMVLTSSRRNYSLLWSVEPYAEQLQADPWQFSIEAERQEHASPSTPTDHSLKLRFSTLL